MRSTSNFLPSPFSLLVPATTLLRCFLPEGHNRRGAIAVQTAYSKKASSRQQCVRIPLAAVVPRLLTVLPLSVFLFFFS